MTGDRFLNAELSWLEFNHRVLEEAQDPMVPLLERVKFLAIFSSNLDEFFMVRMAGLKRQLRAADQRVGPDGMNAAETIAAVSARVHALTALQHRVLLEEIQPLLAAEGVHIIRPKDLTEAQHRFLDEYFHRTLLPVLTPLAIDPGHPFPYLGNRSLCVLASLRRLAPSSLPTTSMAVVHIPSQVVPRFVALPEQPGKHSFVLLEDLIRLHLPRLYHGYEILSSHAIRVTRDAELQPPRGRTEDLLTSIERSLQDRLMGSAVRLQYDMDLPAPVLSTLLEELELQPEDLYEGQGFTTFSDLIHLYTALDIPRLKDRPQPPLPVRAFEAGTDMWSVIREGDVLVHHPYQSFDAVTKFVREAAEDPKVLAIKMTLYRVSLTFPIALALTSAVQNGKEVAVLVELRARFDEEANIRWARALEEVGAHVVYGLVGYKTHCKACLVVRQEADGIRRYCHLSTGNYNIRTASVYSDLGLFTSRESFGEDVTELFNLLTGYTEPRAFNHLLVAPTALREGFVERIRREADHARAGRPARLVAKMNGLADAGMIEELYAASQAGVEIDLIVRGVCCLRPGVPGLSDRIRAISIVDRYLEHARIFYFENGGAPEYWLSSGDWMPRNLDQRVEAAFPVLDPALQGQLREILDVQLADTVKARRFRADGTTERVRPEGGEAIRAQERLYELMATRSRPNPGDGSGRAG